MPGSYESSPSTLRQRNENHVAKRLVLHAIERELIPLAMTTHVVANGPLKTYYNVHDHMRPRIVKVFSIYDPTCRQSISETLCQLRLYDATEMIETYQNDRVVRSGISVDLAKHQKYGSVPILNRLSERFSSLPSRSRLIPFSRLDRYNALSLYS
ncbi:hypothetical protein F4778DRAFT_405676 [Xylariomycetidae sp. FL2044]|nr:hypothetical protein F4778DRAFT_405676 [Xylariomycetidae sp. FL2044]